MLGQNELKNLNIPNSPGSYQFYNRSGKLLYIGKAANLRSRVFSYWRESADHSPAKQKLIGEVAKIEWIEVDSEIEALLLEANLIKKHQPPYNVLLRDDKRFAYIKISTEEEFPRIFLTRTVDKAGRYFGPFTSTEAVREVLKIIRRIWSYRSCRNMPKQACLYHRIGKCQGPCVEAISRSEYTKTIKQVILFLEGKKKRIISNFQLLITNSEKQLKKLKVESRKYKEVEEEIFKLKYQLNNIKRILESSRMVGVSEKYANDVIELAKILSLPKVPQRIEGYDISNLFSKEAVGSMVVFSGGEPDKNEYRKFKIKALAPLTKGVGGIASGGDVHMLREVLERRFKHSENSKFQVSNFNSFSGKSGAKSQDWALPDLIIIDGGKAQVNVAVSVLKKSKLNIPIIGITKGEGLRSAIAPDKLFFPGEKKPLELPLASPALHLIKRVRDEAHRFAIGYHKVLRKKKFFGK